MGFVLTKATATKLADTKLSEELTVKVDGEAVRIFMSWGLLRECVETVGNPQDSRFSMMDTEVISDLLTVTLSPRDKRGAVIEGAEVDGAFAMINADDRELLLDWVQAHVTGFFLKRVTSMEGLLEKVLPTVERLMSTTSGFQNSISKKQSAGLSE